GWMKIITSCLMESVSTCHLSRYSREQKDVFPVAAMVTFSSDREIQEDN
ncbi:hypothetical protein DBR06_SOUSAS87610001, partial [Sousa chinensis]